MPLTPATTSVPTSDSFNFGAIRPSSDLISLSALVDNPRGVVMLNDNVLIVTDLTTNSLVQLSMVDGDPTTLALTGTTFSLAPLGFPLVGQLSYDPTASRLYMNLASPSVFRYLDLTGETLTGATLNPASFAKAIGWAGIVSPDGTHAYFSDTTAGTRIFRYIFAIPGDITSLIQIDSTTFDVGNQPGGMIMTPDSRQFLFTTLVFADNFGHSSLVAPNTFRSTPHSVEGRIYNFRPFDGILNFSTPSRDGTYLFLNGSGVESGVTRFDMD